jgi:putative spermidine/putrescine transport system permease protein
MSGQPALTPSSSPAKHERGAKARLSLASVLFWVAIGFYSVNLVGLVGSVLVNSFGTAWFGTLFPQAFTTRWYQYAGAEHDLGGLLRVTFVVAGLVTLLALTIGVPAAYVLARRTFPGKGLLMALYLLPMLVPPMTYGIPLATLLYRLGLGGSLAGVVLANLVPVVPFAILVLTPFVEQIDVNLESAARMLGANRLQVFRRVLLPLIIPGVLTAAILAIVRTVAMFELTFLVSGPGSQTLVVALYYDAFAAGTRPTQAIDAMAVIYMLTTMGLLLIALRFLSPTQMVYRPRA